MSRICTLTGKSLQNGNRVSHANNKSQRWFRPNLQMASLYSDALGRTVRLRLSTNGIRSVEHRGGLDTFLVKARDSELSPDVVRLKKRILKLRAQA